MTGRSSSAALVRFWQVRGEGCCTAALARHCQRRRSDSKRGQSRTGTRAAELQGTTRMVSAGSTLGPWPNQRPAADAAPMAVPAKYEKQRLGACR